MSNNNVAQAMTINSCHGCKVLDHFTDELPSFGIVIHIVLTDVPISLTDNNVKLIQLTYISSLFGYQVRVYFVPAKRSREV